MTTTVTAHTVATQVLDHADEFEADVVEESPTQTRLGLSRTHTRRRHSHVYEIMQGMRSVRTWKRS
jgi:hypothetical protein